MKRPYFAWWNQARRACRAGSGGGTRVGVGVGAGAWAAATLRTARDVVPVTLWAMRGVDRNIQTAIGPTTPSARSLDSTFLISRLPGRRPRSPYGRTS